MGDTPDMKQISTFYLENILLAKEVLVETNRKGGTLGVS